jgi:alpha-galactosidase
VSLRGLDNRRYRLTDTFTGKPLSTASGPTAAIPASFTHFLLVEATPIEGPAAA